MLHEWKADWFRIGKERLSLVSMVLLTILFGLFAYLGKDNSTPAGATAILQGVAPLFAIFFVTPAKIFFGEDFGFRTINQRIIKSRNRLTIFVYKWLASTFLSLFYAAYGILVAGIVRHLLTGQAHYGELTQAFWQLLPFYLVLISLCNLIFNLFDKLYQSYLTYILLAVLFDQLASQLVRLLLKSDILQPYFMFQQLSFGVNRTEYWNKSSIAAMLFTLVYFGLGYWIFSKREYK